MLLVSDSLFLQSNTNTNRFTAMKKINFYAFASIAALTILAACDETRPDSVAVESVTLDENAVELTVGEEFTLTETVLPANAGDKTVRWSSDREEVAAVADGVVTAVATGTATVTVTTTDGGKSAQCTISVLPAPIAVTGVTLGETSLTLGVGDQIVLTPEISPQDATDKTVTWSSSDEAVASVTDGVVVALEEGSTTIVVTTVDGGKTAERVVMVNMFGQISFKTEETWTVGTQTWSDAIVATRCKKDDFYGGTYGVTVYEADCAQNEPYGDMFSWLAVETYKNVICADGWRLPTQQDFVDLDIAMGGDGENRAFQDVSPYLTQWGGEFGGYFWYFQDNLERSYVGSYGSYWADGESSETQGFALQFGDSRNYITPRAQPDKYNGFNVRCVRNS